MYASFGLQGPELLTLALDIPYLFLQISVTQSSEGITLLGYE